MTISNAIVKSSSSSSKKNRDRIWDTSSNEERQRIKEFWLSLSEDERKDLVRIEKDTVLQKVKEQQRHTCSCSVCGRKRLAIEEELEVLYDSYYAELEQFGHGGSQTPMPTIMPPSSASAITPRDFAVNGPGLFAHGHDYDAGTPHNHSHSHTHSGHYSDSEGDENPHQHHHHYHHQQLHSQHHHNHSHTHGHISGDEDDYLEDEEEEEDGGSEGYADEYPEDEYHPSSSYTPAPPPPPPPAPRDPSDIFNFGNSFSIQGGILTVADDLLKNDGKKFIDMMEQLAERRMAREAEAIAAVAEYDEDGENDIAGEYDDEENDDGEADEDEEEYDDEEEDYDDEYDDDSITEEERMAEGRRMLQVFAARMFEQRVLAAYREKVAHERQQKLLEELEEESRLQQEREQKKLKDKERKKDKKRQLKQAKEEERLKKEAERAQHEAALKAEQERKAEEARQKRLELKKKKDAERKAQEEDKRRKEDEKRKRRELEEKREEEKRKEERRIKEKEEEERKAKSKAQREAKELEEKKRKEDALREARELQVPAAPIDNEKADSEARQQHQRILLQALRRDQSSQPPLTAQPVQQLIPQQTIPSQIPVSQSLPYSSVQSTIPLPTLSPVPSIPHLPPSHQRHSISHQLDNSNTPTGFPGRMSLSGFSSPSGHTQAFPRPLSVVYGAPSISSPANSILEPNSTPLIPTGRGPPTPPGIAKPDPIRRPTSTIDKADLDENDNPLEELNRIMGSRALLEEDDDAEVEVEGTLTDTSILNSSILGAGPGGSGGKINGQMAVGQMSSPPSVNAAINPMRSSSISGLFSSSRLSDQFPSPSSNAAPLFNGSNLFDGNWRFAGRAASSMWAPAPNADILSSQALPNGLGNGVINGLPSSLPGSGLNGLNGLSGGLRSNGGPQTHGAPSNGLLSNGNINGTSNGPTSLWDPVNPTVSPANNSSRAIRNAAVSYYRQQSSSGWALDGFVPAPGLYRAVSTLVPGLSQSEFFGLCGVYDKTGHDRFDALQDAMGNITHLRYVQ